jgi:hypothetical protein
MEAGKDNHHREASTQPRLGDVDLTGRLWDRNYKGKPSHFINLSNSVQLSSPLNFWTSLLNNRVGFN